MSKRTNAGNTLARLRNEMGISQAKLSSLIDISRSIIAQIECGDIPMPIRYVGRLAAFLSDNDGDLMAAWRLDRGGIETLDDLRKMGATLAKLAV